MDDELVVDTSERCCMCDIILSSEELDPLSLCSNCELLYTEAYSEAPVDVDNFLDNDVSVHPNLEYLNQWNSDDDEFEEVSGGESTVGPLVDRVRLHRSLATNGRNLPPNWLNSENQETSHYGRNGGDYVDAREFEEIMELLAETDSLRRGPPPAAVSFVENLMCVIVDEESVCVICKDNACVGSVVNRLPCAHVYHPLCIKTWLNARNTCPLCRYELPTDKDSDKRRNQETQEHGAGEDYASSEDYDDDNEGSNESVGGERWWLVAAPIASVMGIGMLVWLGGGGVFDGQRDLRIRRLWSVL
ncbi:Zinc finger, RING/FYVE/PHD-type [Artemisia annua]|uniref:RING-type E3 ubiquitin transferase n=1 Tax=Artemisia annua TaxID=35608 RepID=A0A2U1NEB5_ARTAN|nr:Zinc finger, RING/FYVE/PHD-type [Artemisia annua]